MGIVILLLLIGAFCWLVLPAVSSTLRLKRRQAEIRSLTRQTIKDMNRITKNDDRLW